MGIYALDRKENIEKAAKKVEAEKKQEEKKKMYVPFPDGSDPNLTPPSQHTPPGIPLPLTQHRPRPTLPHLDRYQFHQLFHPKQDRVGAGDDGLPDGEMYPDGDGLRVGRVGKVGAQVSVGFEVSLQGLGIRREKLGVWADCVEQSREGSAVR